MKAIEKEESGWILAHTWLNALEETARDFHGSRPSAFAERAYEHATEYFIRTLENDYGVYPNKVSTIKDAVHEYIRLGVIGGLFDDASQIDVHEINPNRVEITTLSCPYRGICQNLQKEGVSQKDLTCARLGCFRAAVLLLAGIDCTYEVTELSDKGCHGYMERR